MKNFYWVLIIIAIIILGTIVWYTSTIEQNRNQNANQTKTITKENCIADECLTTKEEVTYPVSALPQNVIDALNKAIDDEYKAKDTYDAVITKFGSVRPFSQIIRAEEQHISSLKAIYDKYGLTIPTDPYIGKIEAPTTTQSSCALGVEAEIANAALYRDNLIPEVTNYPDITEVFTSLMNASQDKHLPAFQKCQ